MSKRDPHILILSSWYPSKDRPFLGNFVERNADLLGSNYQVTLLDLEVDDEYTDTRIQVTNKENFKEIKVYLPKGKSLWSRKQIESKALNLAFEEINNADLIIGHVIFRKGWQFIRAKKHYKVPLLVVEHSSIYRPKSEINWSWKDRLILKQVALKIDQLIAVSDFQLNHLKNYFPKVESTIIGNHINSNFFQIEKQKNEKCHFIHISTLDEKTKNPDGILKACSTVMETTSNFNFTIICDENYTKWENRAKSLGLDNCVEFKGPLSQEELLPYYSGADALVQFSNYESFSIVIAEAWASGTPVISTSVGVAHEMNPEVGIQVEADNTDDLANAMTSIILQRNGFDSASIRRYAHQYSAQEILSKWTDLINKHIG